MVRLPGFSDSPESYGPGYERIYFLSFFVLENDRAERVLGGVRLRDLGAFKAVGDFAA